jgi:hypothetical protein
MKETNPYESTAITGVRVDPARCLDRSSNAGHDGLFDR